MIILFYSDRCNFSKKILKHINEFNLSQNIKLVNIDNNYNIPPQINSVPTIIDTDINKPLEGKEAFNYIFNKKYFNYSTNNINNWKNRVVPKPKVEVDEKALDPSVNKSCSDIKSNGKN